MNIQSQVLVSICCVTYNHEKYICQCLDGFVMQKTNFVFEILVHEDASTDNTASIIREYEQKYPQLFRCVFQTENQFYKQNTLINILFPMARGKYIALCEGDDYWIDPFKLQKQVDFLETNPDFVICFHNVLKLFESQKQQIPYYKSFTLKEVWTIEDYFRFNFSPTCSVVYRNKLFENLPEWFFSTQMGDWPLHILNARYGKIKYIDEIMGVHRLHSQGLWTSLMEKSPRLAVEKSIEMLNLANQYLNFRYQDILQTTLAEFQEQLEYHALIAFDHAYQLICEQEIENAIAKIQEGLKCSSSQKVQDSLIQLLSLPEAESLKQKLLNSNIQSSEITHELIEQVKINSSEPISSKTSEPIHLSVGNIQPKNNYKISVITAVTDNPLMRQAIQSVQDQDYENIEHLIVIDGKEKEAKAREILEQVEFKKETQIMCLPYATGKNRFICHRIYGMSPYIVNGDYISFLDEDNWLDKHHYSSLIELVYENNLDWAYSLRKLVNQQGEFLGNDDCESLGRWMAYTNDYYLVDTNCYLINRLMAIEYSPLWYQQHQRVPGKGVVSADVNLSNQLIKDGWRMDTTGFYTVNYRLGSTSVSVKPEFFAFGNQVMVERYPDGFPWRKNYDPIDYMAILKEEIPFREINLIAFPNWQNSDINIIRGHLAVFLEQVFTHSLRHKLTILLLYPDEKIGQLAEDIINDIFFDNFDWLDDEQIPEIYLQSDNLSPMTKQALLLLLNGYISFIGEDTEENYWKNKLKPLHLSMLTN